MRQRPYRRTNLTALDGLSELALTTPGGVINQIVLQPSFRVETGYAAVIRLPEPIGWPDSKVADVDLVICQDDSGSMYGTCGDPGGVRRAVALSLVGLLRSGPRGSRVAVVHWGSDAPAELAMPLTDPRRHHRRVLQAFAIPSQLGGTDLAAGLSRACELLAASSPDRVQLVLVLTDGLQDVGSALEQELRLLPARCVHILLIDRHQNCTPELERRWRAMPLGSFTRLDLDNAQLSWQAASILANAVGLQMPTLSATPARRFPTRRR
jgi:hypothetical protein